MELLLYIYDIPFVDEIFVDVYLKQEFLKRDN